MVEKKNAQYVSMMMMMRLFGSLCSEPHMVQFKRCENFSNFPGFGSVNFRYTLLGASFDLFQFIFLLHFLVNFEGNPTFSVCSPICYLGVHPTTLLIFLGRIGLVWETTRGLRGPSLTL